MDHEYKKHLINNSIYQKHFYNDIFFILAHGSNLLNQFIVPEGYNFIHIQDIGHDLNNDVVRGINHKFKNDEFKPYLNYIINWETPEACHIQDDNVVDIIENMSQIDEPCLRTFYRSDSKSNPFKYIKHYPPGSTMKDVDFDFNSIFSSQPFEVNKDIRYTNSGILYYKTSIKNIKSKKFATREEFDSDIFKDSIINKNFFRESNYTKQLTQLLDYDYDKSIVGEKNILPKGTYFIMSCRSCDYLEDIESNILSLRQQSKDQQINWCNLIERNIGKYIDPSIQETELAPGHSGESKKSEDNEYISDKFYNQPIGMNKSRKYYIKYY